jgi:hypothetical protein
MKKLMILLLYTCILTLQGVCNNTEIVTKWLETQNTLAHQISSLGEAKGSEFLLESKSLTDAESAVNFSKKYFGDEGSKIFIYNVDEFIKASVMIKENVTLEEFSSIMMKVVVTADEPPMAACKDQAGYKKCLYHVENSWMQSVYDITAANIANSAGALGAAGTTFGYLLGDTPGAVTGGIIGATLGFSIGLFKSLGDYYDNKVEQSLNCYEVFCEGKTSQGATNGGTGGPPGGWPKIPYTPQ